MSWFRTYRENVDDPQNSMMTEMFQLILQARQQQQGAVTSTDTERKRVLLLTTESYLIFISDGCFVVGKQRYLRQAWKWYLGREPDGLVCKCMFDFDYRDNTIIDRSLRGNNGVLNGYPTIIAYQPEYPRSALSFSAPTSQVVIPHNSNIDNLTDFTFTFWVRPVAVNPTSTPHIINKNYPSNNSVIFYFSSNSFNLNFRTVNNSGTGVSATAFNTNNPNVYFFISGTMKQSTGLMELYVNGVLVTTATNTGCVNVGTTADLAFNGFSGIKWGGQLDDVRLWDHVLTSDEINSLMNGEELPPHGLLAQWHFDEDYNAKKAFEEQNYSTGNITDCTYDKVNVPTILQENTPYRDEMIDMLVGYKTSGQYVFIPELEDDFRITGKITGGQWYRWKVKLTTFDTQNNNSMRLMEKCDDLTPNYFQSYQIGSDGRFYCFGVFNGVEKKIRTVNPLNLLKLYDIIAGIDFDAVTGGTATNIFQIYIDGFKADTEVTTASADIPTTDNVGSFGVHLLTGTIVSRGFLVGEIYSFRYYEEKITAANALGLMTNKYTTYNIERGHVARSNMTKLPFTFAYRFITFDVAESLITEKMEAFVTDLVQTGRFTSPASLIPISEEFDAFVSPPTATLGNYAIDLTNTSSIHSWVEIPTVDPVKDHFSVFAWVKFQNSVGDWGGIISAIDGLDNGNRLLIKDDAIRYQGQFDKESNDWEDFRVTVPSISNAWHLIGFTHDGDAKEFRIYLDAKRLKTFHAKGDIRGTDKSKTFIGKGSNNGYYLDGKIDDLFIWDRTLTQTDINKLFLKVPVEKGMKAHFNWERTYKDVENGKFNGKAIGQVKFTTDHV